MSKILTVFGATGNQGGSLIKQILADPSLSKEYKIRAITRDSSKPAAQALASQGVELANADLNSASSVAEAIRGSHTVFLVTNYWENPTPGVEITQGKNVADAAKQEGVQHLIFSSLLNVTKITNGRLTHVPHFDGKAEVEDYIKNSGVPSTFVLPGYFMANLSGMMITKGEDGVYNLSYPISEDAKFPLIDAAEDTGKFAKAAIVKFGSLPNGTQILAATDYCTPKQILADIEEVTGAKTRFNQVTAEQYKSYLPPFIAEEMLENHLLIQEPGYYNGAKLEPSRELLAEGDKPTTWKEFIKRTGAFQ